MDNVIVSGFKLSEPKVVENDQTILVGVGIRTKAKLTKQGARALRSSLGLRVKKGTTFGRIISEVETGRSG